jgi:hypothetical protein
VIVSQCVTPALKQALCHLGRSSPQSHFFANIVTLIAGYGDIERLNRVAKRMDDQQTCCDPLSAEEKRAIVLSERYEDRHGQ